MVVVGWLQYFRLVMVSKLLHSEFLMVDAHCVGVVGLGVEEQGGSIPSTNH